MFNVFKIIVRIKDKISNLLNILIKINTYQCCALTEYDNPAYGKHIALEKDDSYKKRSYYSV